jgi:HTH-type transcriptional regulator/antitoxin HigA
MVLGKHLPAVNEIIQGKRAITPEMAVALGTAFGNGPEFWMQREAEYRLSLVTREAPGIQQRARLFEIAPVKEMERRGWIKQTGSATELERELCRFYDVPTLDTQPTISAAARQSATSTTLNPAQRAWCFRAKRLAKTLSAEPYQNGALDSALPGLRKMASFPEQAKNLPKFLAQVGVRLVVLEHLPQSRIDGAAFWIDAQSPVIALSIRFDRIDCFWHTLCHELSHIRHRDSLSVDDAIVGESKDKAAITEEFELRADQEASETLIPREKIESFIIRVKPFYSKVRIIQFAHRMGVHPGIVAGQLQHLGEISYATNREMLAKIRDLITSVALTDGWGRSLPPV